MNAYTYNCFGGVVSKHVHVWSISVLYNSLMITVSTKYCIVNLIVAYELLCMAFDPFFVSSQSH